MAITVRGDRGAFGGVLTPPQAGPLRLGALSARAASSAILSLGANGDVVAGALVAGDLPSVFTRRDVAEVIGASWTWASGQTISFAAGPLAPPALTSRSLGTRLILEPVPASTEYALGRDTLGQWASVPVGSAHSWYTGATERLRLESDGTLKLSNGTGGLLLAAAGTGDGAVVAQTSLQVRAAGGGITVQTSDGRIVPVLGYRENLGELSRKFLSLHAAELWVETLVAQQTLATIGGRILVGPTTSLTRDVTAADTTIYVKHNAFGLHVPGVELGSNLVLEAAGKFEVLSVTSTTVPTVTAQGDYAYVVTRAWGGTAAAWTAGDAVFDTGRQTAPSGAFIDLYSVRGVNAGTTAGPTIVGNLRTGGGATAWREHWAIGNLQGLYGVTTRTMGAAFGDASGMHLQIDATNGIRFLNAATLTGYWDMAGNIGVGRSTAGQLFFSVADGALRIRYAGLDKLALLSDGTLYLNTGLVAGAFDNTLGVVRSVNASAWNAGSGFYFEATGVVPPSGYAANTARALIGNSAGRRVQWDGASLKVVSDGLTIDENGIALQQQTSGTFTPSKALQWTPSGAYLWDSSTNNAFELIRGGGQIWITANAGTVILQGGGSGIDRATLSIAPTYMELGGTLTGGTRPAFRPSIDVLHDLGSGTRRWKHMYALGIGLGLTAQPGYHIELANDLAAKPVSATWTVVSDGRTKRDVVPVDRAQALALVQAVPLVRFCYTGAFGTPEGAAGIGVIAEQLQPILPASVAPHPGHGALTWNAHELLMLNVAATQALAARLDVLERNTP